MNTDEYYVSLFHKEMRSKIKLPWSLCATPDVWVFEITAHRSEADKVRAIVYENVPMFFGVTVIPYRNKGEAK